MPVFVLRTQLVVVGETPPLAGLVGHMCLCVQCLITDNVIRCALLVWLLSFSSNSCGSNRTRRKKKSRVPTPNQPPFPKMMNHPNPNVAHAVFRDKKTTVSDDSYTNTFLSPNHGPLIKYVTAP